MHSLPSFLTSRLAQPGWRKGVQVFALWSWNGLRRKCSQKYFPDEVRSAGNCCLQHCGLSPFGEVREIFRLTLKFLKTLTLGVGNDKHGLHFSWPKKSGVGILHLGQLSVDTTLSTKHRLKKILSAPTEKCSPPVLFPQKIRCILCQQQEKVPCYLSCLHSKFLILTCFSASV